MPKITNAKAAAFTLKGVERELADHFRAACRIKGKLCREVLLELMEQYSRENLPPDATAGSGSSARTQEPLIRHTPSGSSAEFLAVDAVVSPRSPGAPRPLARAPAAARP